ncbi:MAG: hypothetical protein WCB71_00685, partial [Aestuariivirga sp.]
SDGKPRGYSWKEMAHIASVTEQRGITPVFLPKPVAMTVAVMVEAFGKTTGRLPFVSRDKIQQLYFADWVARGEGWPLKEPIDFAKGFSTALAWYRREQWLPQRFNNGKMAA